MAIYQIWLRYSVFLWIIYLILLTTFLFDPVLPETIHRVDPLALLAGTLRTYQRAGCDSEQLSLSCPRGTSISIDLAQYGRAGDLSDNSLCPPISEEDTTAVSDGIVVHSKTEIEVKPPESQCHWEHGLQYTLLQTVVEACQKKRHCKFAATPKSMAGDPCPGTRKFVEIAYKCRPYEFRSKVACENDNMQLVCNPYSRIAIYSASFGRTQYESVQCSQPHGVKDETCLASWATESVMQTCHGRRRCSLSADSSTFGNPCRSEVKMYLKVVYTCIPRKVLKDRYEISAEPDEPQQAELDLDQDELYDEDQFYKESEAIPPAPKLQGGIPTNQNNNGGGGGGGSNSRSLDFPFNEITSTSMPPLLKRNDNSLEELSTIIVNPSSIYPINNSIFVPKFNNILFNINQLQTINKYNNTTTIKKYNYYYKKCYKQQNQINLIENSVTKLIENNYSVGCTNESTLEKVEVIGFIANWIQTYVFITKHQERFYLYLIISVTAGVLLCLTLVIGRIILQKRRVRKNSSASSNNKSSGSIDGKFQKSTTGETQIPNGFSDDISEIDADIDLTTPVPVPSLSSRNESYLTYAPSANCTYGGIPPPSSMAGHTSSVTTMLMPQTGLVVTCGSGGGGNRQPTPPPNLIGGMPINSTMGGGALMPPPSAISSVSHHTAGPLPSYLMMGHHGTLRRTMIPTSMGYMAAPSPPPPLSQTGGGVPHQSTNINQLGIGNLTTHPSIGQTGGTIYHFDSTIPRSLRTNSSGTANSSCLDNNSQYFYG